MDRRHPPPTLPSADIASFKAKIDDRKRLFYLLASIIALPSILFVWFFYGDNNLFIRYAYPILIAEAGLWIIALLYRRIPLLWIEFFVLFTIGLFYLAKYVYHLFFDNPTFVWREIEANSGAVIILFILAYTILHHQVAFRFTILYTTTTLAFGLYRFSSNQTELLIDFIRLETRLIVIALLTYVLAKVKDDLLAAQQQANYWEWQANIDHLTQLPNRRMISTRIEQVLKTNSAFALFLIDLDDFKCFNDTYGHDVGDLLLSQVAFTLKTSLRAGDMVARWGGEEFLVLVNEATKEQAIHLAERLRSEVEKLDFDNNRISISIGCTLSRPRDDLFSLLKRADTALYAAKTQGRNRVCWQ
ncbi:MAG: GGDEF domain-containing protein [Anaerolineales bacterium]|nr:GGDEF domain-containing protein [Anaerolineales bacterium]